MIEQLNNMLDKLGIPKHTLQKMQKAVTSVTLYTCHIVAIKERKDNTSTFLSATIFSKRQTVLPQCDQSRSTNNSKSTTHFFLQLMTNCNLFRNFLGFFDLSCFVEQHLPKFTYYFMLPHRLDPGEEIMHCLHMKIRRILQWSRNFYLCNTYNIRRI